MRVGRSGTQLVVLQLAFLNKLLIADILEVDADKLLGKLFRDSVSKMVLQGLVCCSLYHAILTEYRIKGKMQKVGWFSQERSVKEHEGVWWNVVVVTPDQWLCTKGLY